MSTPNSQNISNNNSVHNSKSTERKKKMSCSNSAAGFQIMINAEASSPISGDRPKTPDLDKKKKEIMRKYSTSGGNLDEHLKVIQEKCDDIE